VAAPTRCASSCATCWSTPASAPRPIRSRTSTPGSWLDGAVAEAGAEIAIGTLPTVRGDAFQLTQLFENLVDNALKFRGDERLAIRIDAAARDGEWLFSVQDNGMGIDPRYAIHVFTIFQRLHGRDEYRGTGIGLAICRKVVERHGGRIWLESDVGKGCTVHFTLPA
jgi:light-regulated signal transduction histidine kinase (bacteriophytochrome)